MFTIVIGALLALSHGQIVRAALDPAQMQQRLAAGAPILGTFNETGGELSNWMGSLPDDKSIYSLNIPGTHDSCTWNYTGLLPEVVTTQSSSIFNQLDAGIRFLDIRLGVNNSTGQIMVYHGDALLSDTVQLVDVLWGLYHFLDAHPTETIIASLKVDHGDGNDATLQQTLHDQFTTEPTSDYWAQDGSSGTLGPKRHKVVLYRRYTFLPGLSPVGIDLSVNWTDNNADFVINYDQQQFAYIEDLYQINGDNETPATKIPIKFDAVTSHLDNANAGANLTQLFITFVSGYGAGVGDTMTPRVLAVGDPTNNVSGINSMMLPYLQQRKGNRFGIILFDFYESEPGLVAAAIGLNSTSSETSTKPGSGSTHSNSGVSIFSPDACIITLLISLFGLLCL